MFLGKKLAAYNLVKQIALNYFFKNTLFKHKILTIFFALPRIKRK